jgi:glycogen debranching enzyme
MAQYHIRRRVLRVCRMRISLPKVSLPIANPQIVRHGIAFVRGASASRAAALSAALLFSLLSGISSASDTTPKVEASAISTLPSFSSTHTQRFLASHGRRGVLMGYPQAGLEFWAYPLQLVSGYQIGFQSESAATETDARTLLSRIVETPESVTRIYTGPDYVVRETWLVPLDQPAAILRYEVHSAHPLDIIVHFTPVLDLMWPAALGGQTVRWNAEAAGYVMNEHAHDFAAVIGSPQIVAHDSTVNSAVVERKLAFTIKPQPAAGNASDAPTVASVLIAQVLPRQEPKSVMQALDRDADKLVGSATQHYRALQDDSLRVQTPNAAFNDALAWSQIALDQAWVCNPDLGCGIIAGYGPSRPGRRPQYAWFFAGDGLIAANALTSAGAFARARDELQFIARYQDAKTGMVWHELTQSAKYLDWLKYPYMFVHVDISLDYLETVAHYVTASGDRDFAVEHWESIAGAYRYSQTLISGDDHLPHIPADKSAGDEQHRPADDLGLSTAWASATQSFAELAQLTGHVAAASDALKASKLARSAIAANYWDAQRRYWIGSHDAAGRPIYSRGSGPGSAITQNIFTPEQNSQLLEQIASSTFQTDWGTRGIGSDSSIYAPWSYATGSIFSVHSTQSALTFWQMHRPQIAWSIYQSILSWTTLDAPGHIHEVFAGNYFRAQTESVPEQTWSSAGFLDVAVRGLLGIDIHAAQNALLLQPHMPAAWDEMTVDNIRLPKALLGFTLRHDETSVDLDLRNAGAPVAIEFAPEIPLGAKLVAAQCAGTAIEAKLTSSGQDSHASIKFEATQRETHCHLQLTGGVALILPAAAPQIGDVSTGLKLTQLQLHENKLMLDADVHADGLRLLALRTPWTIQSIAGATSKVAGKDRYAIEFATPAKPADGYSSRHVEIVFAEP